MNAKKMFAMLFSLLMIACNPSSDEPSVDDFNVQSSMGSRSCVYSGTLTYSISADITSDFSENNVVVENTVTSSNCTDVPVGATETDTIDTISRSGIVITFNNNSQTETFDVINSTELTLPATEYGTEQDISLTLEFDDARLDLATNEIILEYSLSLSSSSRYLSQNSSADNLPSYFLRVNHQ